MSLPACHASPTSTKLCPSAVVLNHADRNRDIDALDKAILTLAAKMNAHEYEFLCLVREFDERAGWLKWGLSSCAEWLHWRCGISLSAAREKIRVAHALKPLPRMSEVFSTGAMPYSKVRAMTRVANVDNEDSLIEYALTHTTQHVEARCRQMRNVQPASTNDARQTHGSRSLKCFRNGERQTMKITVELPVETGELVMAALDKVMTDATLASSEIDPTSVGGRNVTAPSEERETLAQAQADALVNLAEGYGRYGFGPSREGSDVDKPAKRHTASSANPYHVVLHVDRAALADTTGEGRSAPGESVRADLPVESMRRITCDCAVTPMVNGPDDTPLSVGRKTRVVPAHIKRALWSRDRGCRYPGCNHTRFVDAHHIVHWSKGGETSVNNLMLLCGKHHRLVHEEGYEIRKTYEGSWYFKRPDGRAVPESGYRIDDMVDDTIVVGAVSGEQSIPLQLRPSSGVREVVIGGYTAKQELVDRATRTWAIGYNPRQDRSIAMHESIARQ